MSGEVATFIGDLLGSRSSVDRRRLHERLRDALEAVNAGFDPVTPLRITVGDEFQGTFASVAEAARAALHLRLALLPHCDVRQGIGWGQVSVLQEEPRVEDGPGWWAARAALEAVEHAEARPASRRRRTAFRAAPDSEHAPATAWVEGVLVLLDEAVGGLSQRSLSVLGGLLDGRNQRDLAGELGISPSAVSQRVRADGLAAIVAVDGLWRDATSTKEDT